MALLGHVYKIEYSNPYSDPPGGLPRVLAEIFVPACNGQAARPVSEVPEIADYPCPRGYTVTIAGIEGVGRQLTPDQRAIRRRKQLERRERAKHPLFADQFIEEKLAANPELYAGCSPEDAMAYAEMARWRARIAFLIEHSGELLEYI